MVGIGQQRPAEPAITHSPIPVASPTPHGGRQEPSHFSIPIGPGFEPAGTHQFLASASNDCSHRQRPTSEASTPALESATNSRAVRVSAPTRNTGILQRPRSITDAAPSPTARNPGASDEGSDIALRPVTYSGTTPQDQDHDQRQEGTGKGESSVTMPTSNATDHPTAPAIQEGAADRGGDSEPSPTSEDTPAPNPNPKPVSASAWGSGAPAKAPASSSNSWEANNFLRRKAGGKRYGPRVNFSGNLEGSGDSAWPSLG